LDMLSSKKFVSERFSIEMSTKRIKKYTYQPTPDGRYIIETGHYSIRADRVQKLVKDRFSHITKKDSSISYVDLFIGADEPFSFISGYPLKKNDLRKKYLFDAFELKKRTALDVIEKERHLHYEFIYMERKNTLLYKSSVISIVTDKTEDIRILQIELIKTLLIFGITLFVVILMIYNKTRTITKPIKKLVNNVLRITAGNFEERAEVEGKNEITTLSEKFNEMLATIEGYYNVLEEKVRERTAEVVKQKDQIEEQKKRITDSIIYAKRIQDAILPLEENVNKYLKEIFILYKPKEIVSGDFYWVVQLDDKVYIAAVDCTGHGVPGAFMSMLGFAFLNEIVNKYKNISANEILFKLRENIVTALRQTDEIGGSKDGMDVALCIIDTDKKIIQYAGANNPLYHVASPVGMIPSPHGPMLHEIKADKMPIGISRRGMNPFKNHEFQINEGDLLYLFSDGYSDQFGGSEKWKFLSCNFKKMLIENAHLPMSEQKILLDNTIENWKNGHEQTDDILVIGIRF